MISKPDTTLVVIAKNEQRCIERCLTSAAPYVSKMIVLDTGSTDDTISIATKCGAEVFSTEWKNDFSLARNTALDIAESEFNLILDADEWIISIDKTINLSNTPAGSLGLVSIISEGESFGEKQFGNSWIPRLLPRGVRYRGKIHEQPFSSAPRVKLPIKIGHDGYTSAVMSTKKGRNLQLLIESLKNNPNDPYTLYSIGKEYEFDKQIEKACASYEKAISLINIDVPFQLDLDYRLLCTLLELGRLEECLIYSSKIMEKYTQTPDYFFILGYIFLEGAKRDNENAKNYWLPRAEESWKRCLEIGEQPDLSEAVFGRGSFLAARNLSVIFEIVGDEKNAKYYRSLYQQPALLHKSSED